MRILVTNDDGVEAAGLRHLAGAMVAAGHDIAVVAPLSPNSGSGTALHTRDGDPIVIRRTEHADLPGVPFVGVDGGPALAVMLARLGAFGPPPWGVVSGINHGANTGRSVLHSGTVGAALTAASLGMSALAVSVASPEPQYLATAAAVARSALDVLVAARKRTVLNLNVPDLPADRIRGVRWGRLAAFGAVRAVVAESGESHVALRFESSALPLDPDTDAGLLAANYVAVTALAGVRAASAAETGLDAAAVLAQLTRQPLTY